MSATWVDGTDGEDVITGTDGDDCLDGLAGNDFLDGLAGDDLLRGGQGDDTIDGGAGNDTVDYSDATASVTVDLSAGTATGGSGSDTLSNVEGVTGGSHDDIFAFTSARDGEVYTVDGAGGSDRIDLSDYSRSDATIDASAGTLTVDMGDEQSFTVQFSNVNEVEFSNGTASLVEDGLFADAGSDQTVDEGDPVQLDASDSAPGGLGELAAVGGENQVNTTTDGEQGDPDVGVFDDGSYVVVWEAEESDTEGILGQRYDSAGNAVGGEFQINTTTSGDHGKPEVAVGQDGSFVVVWQGQDADEGGILGQRYDASGNAVGSEFQVNTGTHDDQKEPDIAMADDGSFVVVWKGGEEHDARISGQRYDTSGNAVGGEFQINTTASEKLEDPGVSVADDGSFVVVWQGEDANAKGVFGQRYDASGNAVGSELQVNSTTSGDQKDPDVAMSDDGSFVVVWQGEDADDKGVFGQRYDSGGNAVGNEFQINTTTSENQEKPEIAMSDDGSFVVVWQSKDGGDKDVLGQRFDSSANPLGSEIRINSTTGDNQEKPAVGMAANGDFVAVWEGSDTDEEGIFAQRFAQSSQSLTYSWTQVSGPTVTITGGDTATPRFTAPDVPSDTELVFELTVSNGTNTVTDRVDITVSHVNAAPTAASGTVTLSEDAGHVFAASDFAFADADGDSLAQIQVTSLESAGSLELDGVDVTLGQVISKADIDAGKLSFTPAADASGAGYDSFQFKVHDGTEYSASSYGMTLDVTAVNDAPTISTGGDASVGAGEEVTLGVSVSDQDGDGLSYAWTQIAGPKVALTDPESANPSFTAPATGRSGLMFEVAVSDGVVTVTETVMVFVGQDQPATETVQAEPESAENTVDASGDASADDSALLREATALSLETPEGAVAPAADSTTQSFAATTPPPLAPAAPSAGEAQEEPGPVPRAEPAPGVEAAPAEESASISKLMTPETVEEEESPRRRPDPLEEAEELPALESRADETGHASPAQLQETATEQGILTRLWLGVAGFLRSYALPDRWKRD